MTSMRRECLKIGLLDDKIDGERLGDDTIIYKPGYLPSHQDLCQRSSKLPYAYSTLGVVNVVNVVKLSQCSRFPC